MLLARSVLALEDLAAARDLAQAERIRRREPTATHLNDQLDERRSQLAPLAMRR